MRLDPINLYDYEARAKQVLPHTIWDFIERRGHGQVTTLLANHVFPNAAERSEESQS